MKFPPSAINKPNSVNTLFQNLIYPDPTSGHFPKQEGGFFFNQAVQGQGASANTFGPTLKPASGYFLLIYAAYQSAAGFFCLLYPAGRTTQSMKPGQDDGMRINSGTSPTLLFIPPLIVPYGLQFTIGGGGLGGGKIQYTISGVQLFDCQENRKVLSLGS